MLNGGEKDEDGDEKLETHSHSQINSFNTASQKVDSEATEN